MLDQELVLLPRRDRYRDELLHDLDDLVRRPLQRFKDEGVGRFSRCRRVSVDSYSSRWMHTVLSLRCVLSRAETGILILCSSSTSLNIWTDYHLALSENMVPLNPLFNHDFPYLNCCCSRLPPFATQTNPNRPGWIYIQYYIYTLWQTNIIGKSPFSMGISTINGHFQ